MKYLLPLTTLMALVSAAPVNQNQNTPETTNTVDRRFLNGLPLVGDFLPGGSPGKRDADGGGHVAGRALNGLPLVGDFLPGGSPGK